MNVAWSLAVCFPSAAASVAAYTPLQTLVQRAAIDISVLRCFLKQHWHVIVYTLGAPPEEAVRQRIEAHLEAGERVSLAPEFLAKLARDRSRKMDAYGVEQDDGGLTATLNRVQPMVLTDDEEHPLGVSMQEAVEVLLQEGYPFLEIYLLLSQAHAQQGLQQLTAVHQQLVVDAVLGSLKTAARYRFTESARAMHQAVHDPARCLPLPFTQALWIEHDEPQETPRRKVRALSVTPQASEQVWQQLLASLTKEEAVERIRRLAQTRQDLWSVDIILEDTEVLATLNYHEQRQTWVFPSYHRCKWEQCIYETVPGAEEEPATTTCVPCAHCLEECQVWGSWLATTLRMLQKQYAVGVQDAPPFPVAMQTYETTELVPRVRGRGKPKPKRITHQIPYTLVTYDVSLHALSSPPHLSAEEEAEMLDRPKRANWLTLAEREDVIYERRQLASYERRYPRTAQGRKSGLVKVVYQEPKWIPMLRPDKKKRPTMKEVVARLYEKVPTPTTVPNDTPTL